MSIAYEDTLFADWLRKNRWTLIGGILLIVVVQAYVTFAPKLREESRARSWDLYNTLIFETSEQGLDGIGSRIAQARLDDRIHPWFVFYVTNIAMRMDDQDALQAVRSELDQLDDSIVMATEEGPLPVASFLAQQIDARLQGNASEATNPPATEALVEIALTDSSEGAYNIVATLYPDAAPATVAAFLAAVDDGSFEAGSVTVAGAAHLLIPGFGDADADPPTTLPLERKLGYSHVEGALCTVIAPSTLEDISPRAQLQQSFQLQLTTNHSLDGRRTVFGQVTEGLDALREALEAPDASLELVSIRRAEG
jgi:hypothetical protein